VSYSPTERVSSIGELPRPTFDASQHRALPQLDVNVAMTRSFSDTSWRLL
jgi:hypothetical protein